MSRESDNGHVCPKCEETVYHDQCVCPEPIEDALGQDPFQVLLTAGDLHLRMNAWHDSSERLRATRDTEAIRRSNANTKAFLDAVWNHL